jgi:hypothetical protein
MNPIQHIRRIAGVLAGLAALAAALMAFGVAPAFARVVPAEGGPAGGAPTPVVRVVTRTVVVSGMPGWQIALIAIGAALLAATVAVLLDRARAGRRTAITAAA